MLDQTTEIEEYLSQHEIHHTFQSHIQLYQILFRDQLNHGKITNTEVDW